MTDEYPEYLDFGEEAFQKRPALKGHLGDAVFRMLAKHPGRVVLVDCTAKRREMSAGKLLAVSTALSQRWKDSIPGKRVGIVFPPGMGAYIANLAVVLCGKVPVNLNFTLGPTAIGSCIRRAGIETIITAAPVKQKVPNFPWVEDTRDIVGDLQALSKTTVIRLLLMIWLFPAGWLARRLGVPQHGDNEEAGLLFSSGSTGEPKGVVLTHRNIIGNCFQIADIELLPRSEVLLACLPIFHSFGFTVTLWYPLLTGMKVITLPSPLEQKRIAETVEAEGATVLLGTPTFYRPYFKRVAPGKLKNLKYVVAGAEKTPNGFHEKWEANFGNLYLEGYGLTETSPVVSCNLPDFIARGKESLLKRDGSVGKPFPGIRARITHPDTGETQSPYETGMLQLRGPNIFPGYLDEPSLNAAVFSDGWFITGDLARFDEDGFLYIEGRVSRFSKIGGEMAPHGSIEEHIVRAFDLEGNDHPVIAVTGVADAVKGERLVLLTTVDLSPADLRDRLVKAGLPNLWIPREIKRVDAIPCLASGKLDLKEIADLAAGEESGQ
jgi:acyl-[acyl-carrier-protein]-phospholipid O-acyltransferase/long-chain-fatty-acid--[acyl-carrier-protein] ligase